MIKLKINGQEQNWDGDPDLPLLWFLRDEVGLTGTKYGCGVALCGACIRAHPISFASRPLKAVCATRSRM